MLTRSRRPRPRGFTLIELMVVMVIIAILASLISVAVVKVIDAAKIAKVKTEIDGLGTAIATFKVARQVYPCNFNDSTTLTRSWQAMFPYSTETPPTNLTAAQALVFWLSGFSADRTKPLTGQGTRQAYFPFNPARLHDPSNPTGPVTAGDPTKGQGAWVNQGGATIYPIYYPDHVEMTQPFVYFDLSRANTAVTYVNSFTGHTLAPYKADSGQLVNAQGFQIICAGLDNDHGVGGAGGTYPTNIITADLDNITNFAPGQLGDAKP
jgi:prepilin-type N-terminal cleavage/methylation domain-containing protein